MTDELIEPATLEISQEDHATLIVGEADHGRISFAIEIQDSEGLSEEHDVARRFRKAAQEVGSI